MFASSIFLRLKSNTLPLVGDELLFKTGDAKGDLGEGVSVLLGDVGRLELALIGDLGEVEEELSNELLLVSLILNVETSRLYIY